MIKTHFFFKNQCGFVLIYSAFFFTVAFGLVALAVDLGHAYIVSSELKSVSDAAALTAAASFLTETRKKSEANESLNDPGVAAAVRAATTSAANAIISESVFISKGAVTVSLKFGEYDTKSNIPYNEKAGSAGNLLFKPLTTDDLTKISSFRVDVARSGSGIPTFFARIFGVTQIALSRNSVSILAPRNFLMVIDTSGSMDDISYIRPAGDIAAPNPIWPPAESFISLPAVTASFPILFSPYVPATGQATLSSFLPVKAPEPLTVVLNSSLDFLKKMLLKPNLGDRAAVYYFARNTSIKTALITIDQANLDTVFTPLFENRALYTQLVPRSSGSTVFGKAIPNDVYDYPTTSTPQYNFTSEQFDGPMDASVGLPVGGPIAIPNGNTNIGSAIKYALTHLSKTTTNSTQSITTLILFTDGMPDCAPQSPGSATINCYGQNAQPAQLAAARNYVMEQAQIAIDKNIRIYPITYGNFGDDGTGATEEIKARKKAEAAKATLLFDAIAQLSGLDKHFHIEDTANPDAVKVELDKAFAAISLLIPFSLVG